MSNNINNISQNNVIKQYPQNSINSHQTITNQQSQMITTQKQFNPQIYSATSINNTFERRRWHSLTFFVQFFIASFLYFFILIFIFLIETHYFLVQKRWINWRNLLIKIKLKKKYLCKWDQINGNCLLFSNLEIDRFSKLYFTFFDNITKCLEWQWNFSNLVLNRSLRQQNLKKIKIQVKIAINKISRNQKSKAHKLLNPQP